MTIISQRKQKLSTLLILFLTTVTLESNTVSCFSVVSQHGENRLHSTKRQVTTSSSSSPSIPLYRNRRGRHRSPRKEKLKKLLFEPQNFFDSYSEPTPLSLDNIRVHLSHDDGRHLFASKTIEKYDEAEEWDSSYNTVLMHHHESSVLPFESQKWCNTQRQLLFLTMQHRRQEIRSSPNDSDLLALLSGNQMWKLQQLPNEMMGINNSFSWNDWYCRMVDHYISDGHLSHTSPGIKRSISVARNNSNEDTPKNEEALSQWIQLQRTLVSLGLLHAQQVQLLWATNFCWDTSEADFTMQYQRLLQLEEEEEEYHIEDTIKRPELNLGFGLPNYHRPNNRKKSISIRRWKKLQEQS